MPEPGAIPTAAPPGPMLGAGPPSSAGPGGGPNPLAAAPPNIGAGVMPQANRGNMALALSQLRQAIQLLEGALPNLPMGSELHNEVLNTTKGLLKHMPAGGENQQLDMNTLLQHLRQSAQASPMQALQRAFPSPAGAPPAMPSGAGGPPA